MNSSRTLELELPARSENLTLVRQVLGGVAEAEGWTAALLMDIRLAVTEACSNVVAHAYPSAPNGLIRVSVIAYPHQITVSVRDSGIGIVPRMNACPRGLGLGLQLIVALTTEVRIQSVPDESTDVTMIFTSPQTAVPQ
jgi:serine/threonine-protein kinase RsbW